MTAFHIQLFGYPTIYQEDEILKLPRRKALALLVYLLVTQRAHARDYLCSLLWSDYDESQARAELRRVLATLNKSPLAYYVEADRETVQLVLDETIHSDLQTFTRLLDTLPAAATELEVFTVPFLDGFSVSDAAAFDDWQRATQLALHNRLLQALDRLCTHALHQQRINDAVEYLHLWRRIAPESEVPLRNLMRCYATQGQPGRAMEHYQQFAEYLYSELGTQPEEATRELAAAIRARKPIRLTGAQAFVASLPPMPPLVVGRTNALQEIKQYLGVGRPQSRQQLVLRGWPGIGKTTMTALVAHDFEVQQRFSDGVLWTSLGQTPDLFAELERWAQALDVEGVSAAGSIEDAARLLANAIHHRKILLIVDDVWDERHAAAFKIAGTQVFTLYTTRLSRVAQNLALRQENIYKVPILDEENALELLRTLAPQAVEQYPEASRALVRDLEGLPLALQVAGRLLRIEMGMGWGVDQLLKELHQGTRLLEAQAPADRQSADDDVPQTVAALLRRTTDHLDETTRKRFALLGVFAPKPAFFNLEAMQAVWETEDARPTVRVLVERGLLETIPDGRFQMHALLVQHARSMFAGE